MLLAQIDAIQDKRRQEWAPKETLYLQLTQTAITNLRKVFATESREEIEDRLLLDLSIFAIDKYVAPDNSTPLGQYSLYGSEFHYQIVVDKLKGTHLVILNAWRLSPTLVERRRENAYTPNVDLRFGVPLDPYGCEQYILRLREELEKHATESELRQRELRELELFRTWDRVLKAKEDLERGKEKPLAGC